MDSNFNPRLAAHMSNDNFPSIDVTDKVMEAIRAPQKKKPVRKPLLVAGIAAAILMMCGFGYAASTWQLHGADGTVSLEYRNFTEEDGPRSSRTSEEVEAFKKRLPLGEAGFFYDKGEVYPFALENPVIYTDLEEMDGLWTSPIAVPETIADVFRFKQGNFLRELEIPNITVEQRLQEEAEASADGIAFTLIKTNDIMGAHKEYSSDNGGQLSVFVSPGKGWGTIVTDLKDRDMIKTNVNGREAFAVMNLASGEREVVWMDERGGVPVYCKVSTSTPDLVSQEQLIVIANEITASAS